MGIINTEIWKKLKISIYEINPEDYLDDIKNPIFAFVSKDDKIVSK